LIYLPGHRSFVFGGKCDLDKGGGFVFLGILFGGVGEQNHWERAAFWVWGAGPKTPPPRLGPGSVPPWGIGLRPTGVPAKRGKRGGNFFFFMGARPKGGAGGGSLSPGGDFPGGHKTPGWGDPGGGTFGVPFPRGGRVLDQFALMIVFFFCHQFRGGAPPKTGPQAIRDFFSIGFFFKGTGFPLPPLFRRPPVCAGGRGGLFNLDGGGKLGAPGWFQKFSLVFRIFLCPNPKTTHHFLE